MPMITAADLPDTIPVFPLPGALMLPRARLPLHIFEPRYLAMIEDALATLPGIDMAALDAAVREKLLAQAASLGVDTKGLIWVEHGRAPR